MTGRQARMSELAFVDRDYANSRVRESSRDYSREFTRSRSHPRSGFQNASGAGLGKDRAPAGKIITVLKVVVPVLLVALAMVAAFIYLLLPATKISNVSVAGSATIDSVEVATWADLPEGANWLSVDCAAVAKNLSAHPRVASVSVERRFPDTLVVGITERTPVAVVFVTSSEGRTEAHCVDADGVVFASASMYPAASALPVLSGLEIRGLWYGLKLEGPFAGLLASLSMVSASEPALVSALSELRLVSKSGAPAELLVYTARYKVPVRMRPLLTADLLKSMLLVLDVVESEGLSPSIQEIDLRNETFVYRTKEAVSG